MDMDARITAIAELVAGLKAYEWARIEAAINKKISSVASRVELPDAEEIVRAIQMEF